MSLERKDVRFKMDPDAHAALSVLADTAGVDIGEFVENVVEREVIRRVHEARVVADRTTEGRPYEGNKQFLGQGIKRSCGKCAKHFSAGSGMKHHRIYGAICSGCAEAKKGAA